LVTSIAWRFVGAGFAREYAETFAGKARSYRIKISIVQDVVTPARIT